MEDNLEELRTILKTDFNNTQILREALTHRSFVNENRNMKFEHNERLEFLGDAVLELVVTKFLFDSYPGYTEGQLTSFRAALVKTESLAGEALRLNLGKYILMSRGEESTGGRDRPYILANTVEAIIGAIYLDISYEKAQEFIIQNICYKIKEIIEERLDIDPKSRLQEIAQEATKFTPSYELISAEGPDHNKIFEMSVLIGEFEFGKGKGKSKQDAEQQAANTALKNWDKLYEQYFGTLKNDLTEKA